MRNFLVLFVVLFLFLTLFGGFYVVHPQERGVRVTLGTMSERPVPPGVGLKWPWLTHITKVNVQQATQEMNADCFSADLQQVQVKLKVLYRIPEASVVRTVRDYAGTPFESLIVPRVQEAVKEVTATKTAQEIVKTREDIKRRSLDASKAKVGEILVIEDLVIEDVKLSVDLERAIEAKMVQQQEAEKAVYREQQAETEAKIAVAKAKGEAEAIQIQGEALEKTPRLIELKMVEKWDGVAPQVLGGTAGNLLLPITPRGGGRGESGAAGTANPVGTPTP